MFFVTMILAGRRSSLKLYTPPARLRTTFEHTSMDVSNPLPASRDKNNPTTRFSVASPIDSMAALSILYQPMKSNHLVTPAEPWKNFKRIAARPETTFAPDPNIRATLQDLTNVARDRSDLSAEEALSLEIEKLCTATLAIDEAFYEIGRRLSDAVKEQDKRVDVYDTCYALEAQWNEHHLVCCSFDELRERHSPKSRCTRTSFGAPESSLRKHRVSSTVRILFWNTHKTCLPQCS